MDWKNDIDWEALKNLGIFLLVMLWISFFAVVLFFIYQAYLLWDIVVTFIKNLPNSHWAWKILFGVALLISCCILLGIYNTFAGIINRWDNNRTKYHQDKKKVLKILSENFKNAKNEEIREALGSLK